MNGKDKVRDSEVVKPVAAVESQAAVAGKDTGNVCSAEEDRLLRSTSEESVNSIATLGSKSLINAITTLSVASNGPELTGDQTVGQRGPNNGRTRTKGQVRNAQRKRAKERRRLAAAGSCDGNAGAATSVPLGDRSGGVGPVKNTGSQAGGSVGTGPSRRTGRRDEMVRRESAGGSGSSTPKRSRGDVQTTPEDLPKKRRCQKATPPQPMRVRDVVAEHLKVSIVNEGSGGTITEDMSVAILNHLREMMDVELSEGVPIQFAWTRWCDGVIRMTCHDAVTLQWLRREVANMPQSSVNNYRVVDLAETRMIRATVFVPGTGQDPQLVIGRIGKQNPHLDTSAWTVRQAEVRDEGMLIQVILDVPSVEYLRSRKGWIFYGFGQLQMRIPPKPVGEGKQNDDQHP
ncbi:hypothetical protein DMENIID0001_005310 [Sergentomyia squamirostris]